MTSATISIGMTFGRWTVVGPSIWKGRDSGHRKWPCRCECGVERNVAAPSLTRGLSQSCGCLHREKVCDLQTVHGFTGSAEHRAWKHMRGRCLNPKDSRYAYYGGRGIKVCSRWDSFDFFIADLGLRPSPQHSIERQDVNGNYEPGNVVWATRTEQARNKRNTSFIEVDGKVYKLVDRADQLKIAASTLHRRATRGTYGTRYVERTA